MLSKEKKKMANIKKLLTTLYINECCVFIITKMGWMKKEKNP